MQWVFKVLRTGHGRSFVGMLLVARAVVVPSRVPVLSSCFGMLEMLTYDQLRLDGGSWSALEPQLAKLISSHLA